MKILKNKFLITILLITIATLSYQQSIRFSITKQVGKLADIEGHPEVPYKLFVLIGNKCEYYGRDTKMGVYLSKPQDVPVLPVIWSAIKSKFCSPAYMHPHMILSFEQRETYQTSSGEVARYADYIWSFYNRGFVPFHQYIGGNFTGPHSSFKNASFYKDRHKS